MWRMARALSDPELDVLLYPTVYSYVPVISRSRKVVMIHDVIAERFPELTLPRRMARCFWRLKVLLARRQASAIVTVSEHSRQQLVQVFRLSADRVHVVGEASDPVFRVLAPECCQSEALRKLSLLDERRKIVYVGGFNPHKNLELLLEVFRQLCNDPAFADVRLVLVGDRSNRVFHSYLGSIERQIDKLQLQDRVVFTGFLPDDQLVCLLNQATVLVLPSLLEGFGLPAVEAAACGLPVVATTASPLPALLGDGGLYVDPQDRVGWLSALRKVLSEAATRQHMRAAGLAAAGRLTWDAAARQLLNVLEHAAK
jgi:glycosyltransferase involved in cell wall biosynthesis